MTATRLNVLVYSGTGTTSESLRHCVHSLRRLLEPNYAVIPVAEAALLAEPWAPTCALLVVPGGADLGYCRVLNGPGNRRIADFVRRGGAYLGFCAGAYYASARCEFEVGHGALEVVGPRELAFFPAPCRGAAFAGFEYRSERGARAAALDVAAAAFSDAPALPRRFSCYYNGGGVFVDAAAAEGRRVEVLATYAEPVDVDAGAQGDAAAVVLCHVGDGRALLCGPHPEFAAANLAPQPDVPGYHDLVRKLADDDAARVAFLRACLTKLGLEPNHDAAPALALSDLHLSAADGSKVSELLCAWGEAVERRADGQECIRGEADTFDICSDDGAAFSTDELRRSLPADDGAMVDYAAVAKRIVAHENGLPARDATPRFDHELYYASLARFRAVERDAEDWGDILMYGDVVTSTSSLLHRNPKLMSKLPTGFTFTASTQVAGRGRGTNVWIAPPGALMFSTMINHPAHLAASRPVVFVQYLAAVAVVEAIQSLGAGYEALPVKLKWPNDIYALDPTKPAAAKQYVKIGGILSQCGYADGAYQVVLGIGINATNPRPTTSLVDLVPAGVAAPRLEALLARILTRLEAAYAQFVRGGFSADLERRYYRHWLHTGQAVVLEAEGGARARVVGITRDWGMLRAEETDAEGRATGRVWTLQSDENSFDFWTGLVRRKR